MLPNSQSSAGEPHDYHKRFANAIFDKALGNIDGIDSMAQAHGVSTKALFVIWSEKHQSILHDPMTNKPVSGRNKKHLEDAAKAFEGVIIPASEAVQKLLKKHQN